MSFALLFLHDEVTADMHTLSGRVALLMWLSESVGMGIVAWARWRGWGVVLGRVGGRGLQSVDGARAQENA